jgi:hypothetical protein
MTTTTDKTKTLALELTVEQWDDIAELLHRAAGNARGTDREARLWQAFRTIVTRKPGA